MRRITALGAVVIGLICVAYATGRRAGITDGVSAGWAMASIYTDMKERFDAALGESEAVER